MSQKSVFREEEWRNNRHFLNPSKFKEYELHASGLGFLNKINFLKDYFEKFTPVDEMTEEEIKTFHKKTTIHLIRKKISEAEKALLEKHGFRLVKTWATLILDTAKELSLDKNTAKNIRIGEKKLDFHAIKEEREFREYHTLFRLSRAEMKFRTPAYCHFLSLFRQNKFYKVFVAKNKETNKIVAGLGAIHNNNYLLEINAARDSSCYFANDFLKWKIIEFCRKNSIKYYDFAGCNPNPEQNSKDYNLKKYKEKWGGEFFYEYICKR